MKTLSISPAEGWRAVFSLGEKQPPLIFPVACWALREFQWDDDTTTQAVDGMVSQGASLIPASDLDTFLGYIGPGQPENAGPEQWWPGAALSAADSD